MYRNVSDTVDGKLLVILLDLPEGVLVNELLVLNDGIELGIELGERCGFEVGS